MKLTFRTLIIALAALVGVSFLVLMLIPKPVEVDTAVIESGELLVTVDEDGQTRIVDSYVVTAPFAGRILRSDLDPGDEVIRGETVLARIEPPPVDLLDDRAAAEARARIRAAEATLEQVEPAIQQAKVAVQYAKDEFERADRLFKQDNLALAQRDRLMLQYETATQDLRRSQINSDIARFELEMAKAALLQAGGDGPQSAKPHFEIISPISGQVLRQWQQSEAVISGGSQLLELGDPRHLEVVVDVLSSDAVQIKPQAAALLADWGGEHPLEAAVRRVEPQGFTKISALGVEEQRVNIILDLVDERERRAGLGAGFRVHARIVVYQRDDVVKAPVSSLFREAGQWSVFVVGSGTAELRRVDVGRRNDMFAEILDGLRAGEVVVLHPSDKLSNGSRIRIADG